MLVSRMRVFTKETSLCDCRPHKKPKLEVPLAAGLEECLFQLQGTSTYPKEPSENVSTNGKTGREGTRTHVLNKSLFMNLSQK